MPTHDNDTDIRDFFLREQTLAELQRSQKAMEKVRWDSIERRVDAWGRTSRIGHDFTTGSEFTLSPPAEAIIAGQGVLQKKEGPGEGDGSGKGDPPKSDQEPGAAAEPVGEQFQQMQAGVVYNLERRPDGSVYLLGETGRELPDPPQIVPPAPQPVIPPGVGLEKSRLPKDYVPIPGVRQELGTTAADTAGDILGGVFEGQAKAFEELNRFIGVPGTDMDLYHLAEALNDIAPMELEYQKPVTTAGQVTSGLTQAGVGMAMAHQVTRPLQAAGGFLRWTATGALTDLAFFDPDDPALDTVAQSLGELDSETLENMRLLLADSMLTREITDSDLEKRLKVMGQGALVGSTIDALLGMRAVGRKVLENPSLAAAVGLAAGGGIALSGDEAQAAGLSKALTELAEPFFSKALRTVEEATTNAASAEQWRGMLKNAGVKEEEMSWIGLDTFFQGKKQITKEELETYVRNNQVEIVEVEKGIRPNMSPRQILGGDPVDTTVEIASRRLGMSDDSFGDPENIDAVMMYPNGMFVVRQKDGKFWTIYERTDVLTDTVEEAEEFLAKMEAEFGDVGNIEWTMPPALRNAEAEFESRLPGELVIAHNPDDPSRIGFMVDDSGEIYGAEHLDEALYDVFPNLPIETRQEIVEEARNLERMYENLGPPATAGGPPEHGAHVMPGGKNYRELLLTLPERPRGPALEPGKDLPEGWEVWHWTQFDDGTGQPDDWVRELAEQGNEYIVLDTRTDYVGHGATREEAIANARPAMLEGTRSQMAAGRSNDYRSPHWSEPNVFAHVRFNDRTTADGRRVLFIEEVQSDWHQAGRRRGYRPMGEAAAGGEDMVPDAPFKSNWHELALRRMIRYAAEQGYDAVSWTPGKVQSARYDLSRVVESISVYPRIEASTGEKTRSLELMLTNERGSRTGALELGVDKDGVIDNVSGDSARFARDIKGKKLEEVVGKDLADKIMAVDPNRPPIISTEDRLAALTEKYSKWGREQGIPEEKMSSADELIWEDFITLEQRQWLTRFIDEWEAVAAAERTGALARLTAEDLRIGAAGMEGFYDKMLVKYANRLGKKFDTKVEVSKVKTRDASVLVEVEDEAFDRAIGEAREDGNEQLATLLSSAREKMRAGVRPSNAFAGIRSDELERYLPEAIGESAGQEVWTLPISEKLRDVALKQGFPLFGLVGGTAAGLTMGGEEARAGEELEMSSVSKELLEAMGRTGQRRIGKTGRYVGAPPGTASPQKLAAMRRNLEKLAVEGEAGRFWYERSGQAILDMFNGDVDEADKFIKILAILSPENPVALNFEQALKVYYQIQRGDPISAGRYPKIMARRIEKMLETGEIGGKKVGSFYANLMWDIDPSRVPADAVTVDRWMLDAFGYPKSVGTETAGGSGTARYAFVRNEIKRIADKLGWTPHQVQAAMWVRQKTLKQGIEMGEAKFDFADAVARARTQISWEAIPHPSSGHLPELQSAPVEVKAEYHRSAAEAFLDEGGQDRLAKALGMPSPGSFEAPGAYKGEVQPGEQTVTYVPGAVSAKPGQVLDKSAIATINAYAATRATLLRQEAIAWHRPVTKTTQKDANGVAIRIGRLPTQEETETIYKWIIDNGGDPDWVPISTQDGWHFLNFGDVPNKDFYATILGSVEAAPGDTARVVRFRSEGDNLSNDWRENPNGEGYRAWIGEAGRPDLQSGVDRVYSEIAERLDALDAEFAERYGFTARPRLAAAGGAAGAAGLGLGGEEASAEEAQLAAQGTPQEGETETAGLLGRAARRLGPRFARMAEGLGPRVPPPPKTEADILSVYDPYRTEHPIVEGLDFNMARLQTTDQVKLHIDTVSRAYADKITATTGGVVPHKVTRQIADLLGTDPDLATKHVSSLPGDTANLHARALAMRDTLVAAAEEVDRKAFKIATDPAAASDADRIAFREALTRFHQIQIQMKGVQTEIGRALSAFRIPAETPSLARAQIIAEHLNAAGGRGTVDELARDWLVSPVDKRGKFIEQGILQKTAGAVREFWINSLLSGVRSHEVNFVGNNIFTLWQVPERLVAGGIGAARHATRKALGLGGASDRVRMYEAAAMMHGLIEGFPDAVKLAWGTLKTGEPASKLTKMEYQSHRYISSEAWDLDPNSVLGRFTDIVGTGVRMPGTALMAADEYQKGIARAMERRALAFRLSNQAYDEGQGVDEAAQLYADVMGGRHKGAEDMVGEFADTVTYTKQLGEVGQRIQGLVRAVPGGWIVMPFIRTPVNIFKEGFKRNPVTAAFMPKSFWADLKAGGARADLAVARVAVGSAAMAWASHLAAGGYITGSGPTDPKMFKAWRQAGYEPYSIRASLFGGDPDVWIPYGRMEPLSLLFGMAADYADYMKWAPRDLAMENAETLAATGVFAIAEQVASKSFLTGVSDFHRAASDFERYGERYIQRLTSTFTPWPSSMGRDVARAVDPAYRDTRADPYQTAMARQWQSVLNGFRSVTPGLSSDLPANLNFWGEEIKAYDGSWLNSFYAFRSRKKPRDPVFEEVLRLNFSLDMPARRVGGVQLGPEQYHNMIRAMNEVKLPNRVTGTNQTMRERYEWLIDTGHYQGLINEEMKIRELRAIRDAYKDVAQKMMLNPGSDYYDDTIFDRWLDWKSNFQPYGQKYEPAPWTQ